MYTNNMNRTYFEKFSKDELINMLMNQYKPRISPKPDILKKPMPAPRPVKKMVQDYENNIQKPVPAPRPVKKTEQVPIPAPRTFITQVQNALKGYTKSYEINIKNNKDPLVQLQNTRTAIGYHVKKTQLVMKGLKFVETLELTFKKLSNGEIIYKTAYFNGKAQLVINEGTIIELLQTSQHNILSKIAIWISEGSGWTISEINNHYLNVVLYKPMRGLSYIPLPQGLKNRGLINMKNKDNECFRWCHIRHLNPQDKNPQRIKKSDKLYINDLDYSEIEFPVNTIQYNEIEKKNNIRINVFGNDDHMELLLIIKEENKHVLIEDFNKLMYNQTKHKERKHFCMHFLQFFSSERVLENHEINCIQVNGTQAIKMPIKDDNILKFNNFNKQ